MIKAGGNEVRANLRLLGRHNALNALAATAVVSALGIPLASVVKGLESLHPVKGRLAPVAGINNSQILDDTYNANPDSARAALDVLATRENTVFVLGDMGELGENAVALHEGIGELALKAGVDRMYCLGQYSRKACEKFGAKGKSFTQMDDLVQALKQDVTENMTILVKGSRTMQMERAVAALSQVAGEAV